MQCSICSRPHSFKLPFHCPGCARHSLYELRTEHAKALLRRETTARDVEKAVSKPWQDEKNKGSAARNVPSNPNTRWEIEQSSSISTGIDESCRDLKAHAESLRKDIANARAEVSKLKASLNDRRADFTSVTQNLSARRKSTLDSIERSIIRTVYRADQQHQRTAESRIFLCREAAKLYDLRQRRRRRGNTVKEDYLIGGVGIVDLRDLNNAPPTQITTSLTHISQLVVLVSHYLSLQLPAEITLPHRDYPLATIFSPSSSYTLRPVPFPGSTSSQPSHSNTADIRPHPRPRPLFLDKPLPQLAKEDSIAYSLFIEGVTLLAWDVAWVCRTQGINVGAHSWDEVCALGKNLWQLLASTPSNLLQPVPRVREPLALEGPDETTRGLSSQMGARASSEQLVIRPQIILGHYSHGTAHSFLSGAEGTEFMRGWKLQGPMKLVDRLKSLLLGELAGAEWEVLDQNEWGQEATDVLETPVILSGGKQIREGVHGERDGNSGLAKAGPDADSDGHDIPKEKSGTSGWTKLRPR
ncbi:MAG: hypothetical protein M1816_008216 [Peltula sp. TS41687]|nr:MAG: hypothetical protein M1816_008216 [Peltula sp. TS41687]